MNFLDVVGRLLVIFFAIAMGYLANRRGVLGRGVDQKLSKLVLSFTMPCMIVGTVLSGDTLPELSAILSVLKVAAVFYGMEFTLALILPRFLGGTPGQKGVWRYTLSFPNVGFIGYPVAVALFGQEALFYAVVLALPFNMLSYTLGPLMLVGVKKFSWRQLASPCVVAAALSLVLALSRVRPPEMVGEVLNFVGDITVPLSLLIVGSLLAGLPARQVLAAPRLWVLAAVRLLLMPALLWLLLQNMSLTPMILGIAVVQMSMPTAVNGAMLSMEYGGDTECMVQATFVTTLLSIVTLPLVASVLL